MLGWILVNVVLPLVLPVLGMGVFMLLPLGKADAKKVTLMATVKDGQLCWAAVGFCAAALYELHTATPVGEPGIAKAMAGWATGGMMAVIAMAAMAAAGGAVFTTEVRKVPPGSEPTTSWLRHYKLFAGSVVMTAIAAVTYTVIHFNL